MKYLLSLILIFMISLISYSQDYPRLNLWSHEDKFSGSEQIILVKGYIPPELAIEYNEICEEKIDDNYVIKNESELTENDKNRHLFFIGLSNGFNQISEILPAAMKILDNGFSLGPYQFTDSSDVIWLYSSDSKRLFYLGNSIPALLSLNSMMIGMEQYVVVEHYRPTHFGYLKGNGQFDREDHVDTKKSQDQYLKKRTTEYFDFYYSPNMWTDAEADSITSEESQKLTNVLNVLQLNKPVRKINAYVYNDKYQKYLLSYTYGYGNVFNKAWEIHTLGTGSIEHESIHLIYDNECPNELSFISEGIVGYYYCVIDSNKLGENRKFVKEHFQDVELEKYILDDEHFWTNPKYGYPFSANFTKYIIDHYGLDNFKIFGNQSDISKSCLAVYGKTLTQMIKEWEADILN